MKILFVIRSAQSDKAVSIGFAYSGTTFEGEVDIEVVSESGSAAFDIILTYGTGCILKLLNKEFSFPQLQYSYQYRTLIRRAVHSQMAVQYWG